jgi:thiamine-monophosphate kinase
VDEFEIIRRYFERESSDKDIRVGIGDDGAVLIPFPDRDLISVVDTLVSGIHFPETLAPEDIGYRAVAVNLSDVAAMGGRPRWMTLALTLADSEPVWLAGFARGLFEAAGENALALVGGDTTRGSETVISVQIIADVEPGKAMTRAGAEPGDAIYVTGTVGDAAAGLSILQSGLPTSIDVDYLTRRFSRPAARIEVGAAISHFAHAAIDLSDGLYSDLEKLLASSGVAGSLEVTDIPLSSHLTNLMDADAALRFALGGGDDYELCFTASVAEDKISDIAESSGVAITRVGRVEAGSGLSCTRNDDQYRYQDAGYRHFH